ncbi:MAG: hypothetical protein JWM40_2554, partial [Frankiales bacterium]|nr:hypothetical protein [Frankiales bacterium]
MSYLAAGGQGGGAALDQVFLATGIAVALSSALLAVVWAHRTRRTEALTRLGNAM